MKMKNYILVLIAGLSFSTYSQNKVETSEWILRQLNLHQKEIHKMTQIIIRNDSIIDINYSLNFYNRMALKDIQTIQIVKNRINNQYRDETYYEVRLQRTDDKKLVESGENLNGKLSYPDQAKRRNDFYFILDEFLEKDNVKGKLENAFLKLVQLNNGKAKIIKDPF